MVSSGHLPAATTTTWELMVHSHERLLTAVASETVFCNTFMFTIVEDDMVSGN
jgi:hypothetical protein